MSSVDTSRESGQVELNDTLSQLYPDRLPPVEDGGERPFWTVIVPIYNRLDYLEKSLNSILDQDPGPEAMEIIVQDDSSDIDIESAVTRLGRGRVGYNRTASRLGLYGNTNDGLLQSRGHWIHVLHDDDYVLPLFYQTMHTAVENLGDEVGVACSHFSSIRERSDYIYTPDLFRQGAGILENWVDKLAYSNVLQIPAVVVRRTVFEKIGVFAPFLNYTGDWEFYIRAANHYQWWYQPENLARFLVHDNNLTSTMMLSGEALDNIRITIERMEKFLPPAVVADAVAKSRVRHSLKALEFAGELLAEGNSETAIKLAQMATVIDPQAASAAGFYKFVMADKSGQLRKLAAAAWGSKARTKA